MFGRLLPEPEPFEFGESLYSVQRVMSLQNANNKMSKSDKSQKACINLIDDPEVIRLKIMKAKTDSRGTITYEPKDRPELANLLRIYSALEGIDVVKSPQLFEGDNMFSFKEKLVARLIDSVCPIGEKALDLCTKNEDYLLEIIDSGS